MFNSALGSIDFSAFDKRSSIDRYQILFFF